MSSHPTTAEILAVFSNTSQLISSFAVIAGVVIAYQQLTSWRDQRQATRRSEVAEEAILFANRVSDELKRIRNPLDSIPIEEKDNKLFGVERRYRWLVEANELFAEARVVQIKLKAVLGDDQLDRDYDELLKIRNSVAASIQVYADLVREPPDQHDPALRQLQLESRRVIWGHYGDNDELGSKQLAALKNIEDALLGYVRMQQKVVRRPTPPRYHT
ncbi:hypothetical protein [Paracoccus zhejiangensis]|uniref:hypothetical protein n=1 Tax=Paracoccus zhejiangensis TaxID=1077935 RepID=UPI0012FFD837|nr:hypothetical protein [Paracoccus zhejiangensis]